MNIPFQITMVMTYGWFQRSFNPEKQYNPTIHACAGAFAGSFTHIFGQMSFDLFSFGHSKSKNFQKSLPNKAREIKCINYRILKNSFSVKLIHFHFTNYLAWNFSNCLAHQI